MGAAAIIYAVVPVQQRKGQDHEPFSPTFPEVSATWTARWPVPSGFKLVDPNQADKKLLDVKDKRNVRVLQVPLMDVSSMNGRATCSSWTL